MDKSETQGWALAVIAAILCFLGGLLVYIDIPIRKFTSWKSFDIKSDRNILVGGLSLGSGVLLFTALWEMFPESKGYIESACKDSSCCIHPMLILVGTFMLGVIGCTVLNILIDHFTPESIIHCGSQERQREEFSNTPDLGEPSLAYDEDAPLLRPNNTVSHEACGSISSCAGYTNPCAMLCKGHELQRTFRKQKSCQSIISDLYLKSHSQNFENRDTHSSHGSGDWNQSKSLVHHHHKTNENVNMWSIGIETAAAIGMHKFPEGFIMFMTSQENIELGILLCIALGIHNIVEGLTIALPLYVGTHSRWKALLAVFVLGAGAQPLGSLAAMLWLRLDSHISGMVYGLIFAYTAGFMTSIAISSMLFQAIRMDTGTGRLVTTCFFTGVTASGISLALLR